MCQSLRAPTAMPRGRHHCGGLTNERASNHTNLADCSDDGSNGITGTLSISFRHCSPASMSVANATTTKPLCHRETERESRKRRINISRTQRASEQERARLREIGGAHGACGCVLDCREQLLGEFDVSFAILCCKEDDLVCGSMEQLIGVRY